MTENQAPRAVILTPEHVHEWWWKTRHALDGKADRLPTRDVLTLIDSHEALRVQLAEALNQVKHLEHDLRGLSHNTMVIVDENVRLKDKLAEVQLERDAAQNRLTTPITAATSVPAPDAEKGEK